jgi:hypothetical protein
MAAIPGWAYLTIGIAVSVLSKIVEKVSKKPGTFALFFWVGILFLVVGLVKLVLKKNKKEQKNISPAEQFAPVNFQQRQNMQSQNPSSTNFSQGQHHISRIANPQQRVQHPSIISCPSCGTRHYDYAHYCMRCGTHLRRR